MEDKRTLSIVINIFISINIIIWLVLGTMIAFNLHPCMPNQPTIKWAMTILSFIAATILVILFYFLNKEKIIAYRLIILYFFISGILLFFDDFGWTDLLFLIFIIIPIILLIIERKRFVQNERN
jgi:hypothetical protein